MCFICFLCFVELATLKIFLEMGGHKNSRFHFTGKLTINCGHRHWKTPTPADMCFSFLGLITLCEDMKIYFLFSNNEYQPNSAGYRARNANTNLTIKYLHSLLSVKVSWGNGAAKPGGVTNQDLIGFKTHSMR